ncbi:polymorphic toxin type 23 domain-containing protein [Dysgonomonas sp. ZJ709]|uniref:polymorphic toxin type 23 domain-containing protein n=1 Tax=Dysgonomonas sp. ZJ709 TaxID=2709797 RepID=UPI0013EE2360|nr:polymorphic toxin type 23 domain-containing protein [Dysgonomonas sp. ZJ709]
MSYIQRRNEVGNRTGLSIAYLLLFLLSVPYINAQNRIHFDNDDITSLTFRPNKPTGFSVSMSVVAMFTAGAADRSGFRLGGGITVAQTVGDWTFSTGFDAYKATEKFGLGTSFAGTSYYDGRYGASYYVNRYYQEGKQISAIVGVEAHDFKINFEDDILAFPFTGFAAYDRYRTAALELQYKGFVLGTNVYTTDINGMTDASFHNSNGIYTDGKQISSPIYLGYTTNNVILRYGLNSKTGGFVGQNAWHRKLFNTPDFKSGDYRNKFIQIGAYKPYTLY